MGREIAKEQRHLEEGHGRVPHCRRATQGGKERFGCQRLDGEEEESAEETAQRKRCCQTPLAS